LEIDFLSQRQKEIHTPASLLKKNSKGNSNLYSMRA